MFALNFSILQFQKLTCAVDPPPWSSQRHKPMTDGRIAGFLFQEGKRTLKA